jgi:hypothetical protein
MRNSPQKIDHIIDLALCQENSGFQMKLKIYIDKTILILIDKLKSKLKSGGEVRAP